MMKFIFRAWRILATGLCFFTFGLGGLLLTLTVVPTISAVTHDKTKRQARTKATIGQAFRTFIAMMRSLGVMSFSTEGIDKLTKLRGAIVIANHPSLIDVVLLGAMMQRFDCIVKQSLWRHPLLRGVIEAAGFIPNNAGNLMIDSCRKHLSQGQNIVIFPEGTRTTPGQPLKLQRGAAQIALRTSAPVQIVHISCVPTTLSKGESWYNVPSIKPHFVLRVGKLIDSTTFIANNEEYSVAARQLTRYLTKSLEKERV